MSNAELRNLLTDCLALWSVAGRIDTDAAWITLETRDGVFAVSVADADLRPVRWFLQTPERRQAGRPPRAIPSLVALLSALRNAMGGESGNRLRIGSGGAA